MVPYCDPPSLRLMSPVASKLISSAASRLILPSAVRLMSAAAAALSTVVILRTPFVAAAIVAVSSVEGVITILSSVTTVVPVLTCVAEIFLKPEASLLESTTTALEAATVPAVIPSSCSRSASLISAEPMVRLVAQVIEPLNVAAPASDISRVRAVMLLPPSLPLNLMSLS